CTVGTEPARRVGLSAACFPAIRVAVGALRHALTGQPTRAAGRDEQSTRVRAGSLLERALAIDVDDAARTLGRRAVRIAGTEPLAPRSISGRHAREPDRAAIDTLTQARPHPRRGHRPARGRAVERANEITCRRGAATTGLRHQHARPRLLD